MKEHCSRKKDSNPPICAVHNVPLVMKQLPDELIAAGYKGFTFLVCPVSGEVLNEENGRSKINCGLPISPSPSYFRVQNLDCEPAFRFRASRISGAPTSAKTGECPWFGTMIRRSTQGDLMRSCGAGEQLSPSIYHAGRSGDVALVMADLARTPPIRGFALVGYSMGVTWSSSWPVS